MEESIYQRCSVVPEVVNWSDFEQKLKASIFAGTTPDLITVDGSQFASYARQEMLAALDSFPNRGGCVLG